MCGIAGAAGFFEPGLIGRMCDAMIHRGPDSDGTFELPQHEMALGMRRLAIIDLATGDQPMFSRDRRVALVLNGEIYNFRELREQLRQRGHVFATSSDTEVVLAAYLEWGTDAWHQLNGMFAVALIDCRESARMIVVRDRVGIKPLYYVSQAGRIAFASELKALLRWGGCPTDVDLACVRDYLALRYVPGPGSLIQGVRKLPAGHYMEFSRGKLDIRRWWTPPDGRHADPTFGADGSSKSFGNALREAVRRHMISDVPIGAFLSGGIDSSVIVALMAEASQEPVHTFSIGFPDFPDDDRRRAAITAKAFGTDHQPIECRAGDFENLSDIAWHLDEPVGDAIVVPLFVLAREARRKVKVVLSGEGADEILGGYMFHRRLVQLDRLRKLLPRKVWPAAAALVRHVPLRLLEPLFDYPGALGSEGRAKVADLLERLGESDLVQLYRSSISLFDDSSIADLSASSALTSSASHLADPPSTTADGTALQRLIQAQYSDWLPDLILTKADKMTMAHSLELRVPYMDVEVIEAAARLPDRAKLGMRTNKVALRDFAKGLLPEEVRRSPKRAFYIPLESYIEAPGVRDLVRRTLDPSRVRRRGLFRPEWIQALQRVPRDAGFLPLKRLFSIVMLELWFERFAPDASWA